MENKNSRVVWITGASSGIGKSLAKVFALQGDMVVASARTESKLVELQKHISDAGFSCDVRPCDVQDESSVTKAAEYILMTYNRVDVLINNAGVTYFKDFFNTTTEEFDHVVRTNLRGPFLATKALLPAMLQRQNGLVMNVLSYITKEVYTKSAVYSASKAGVEAMMNVLRSEVRRQGIHIVNIYPGAVSTPMWQHKELEKYGNQMLTPEQVAEMLYQISIQPLSMMVEEIILRPQGGDLKPSYPTPTGTQ